MLYHVESYDPEHHGLKLEAGTFEQAAAEVAALVALGVHECCIHVRSCEGTQWSLTRWPSEFGLMPEQIATQTTPKEQRMLKLLETCFTDACNARSPLWCDIRAILAEHGIEYVQRKRDQWTRA